MKDSKVLAVACWVLSIITVIVFLALKLPVPTWLVAIVVSGFQTVQMFMNSPVQSTQPKDPQ